MALLARMSDELPRFAPGIAVVQGGKASNLEGYGAALIFVPEALANLTIARERRSMGKLWLGDALSPLAPYSDLLVRTVLARNRLEVNPEQELEGCFMAVDLPNEFSTRALVVAVKKDLSMFQMLELAGKAVTQAMAVHPASIALIDAGLDAHDSIRAMEAACSAVLVAAGPIPNEKQRGPTSAHGVESLSIFPSSLDTALLSRIQATAEGTNLCKYLTGSPANTLDNLSYRKWVHKLAAKESWQVTELDEQRMAALGCGAFLAGA
jgi:leucyl aminopeptidase